MDEWDDSLFEHTKMTFGEHLDELRVVLFRALIGLVIGFVVGLSVAKYVVRWINNFTSTPLAMVWSFATAKVAQVPLVSISQT